MTLGPLDFKHIMDYRGYMDSLADPTLWRMKLREQVFTTRGGRSDLTQRPLTNGFHLHEGVFERKYLPKDR